MRPFAYVQPASIAEAIDLLAREETSSRFLAGGTDLLTLMKQDISSPEQLIDIKRLSDLDDAIEPTADGLRIGAIATLSQVEDDPLVRGSWTALSQAAALAATPQLRNMATIGGNLLQRPRCWYFRSERITCWLQGGDECQAREGENQLHALFGGGASPCVAVHPSDLATALVTLDASVTLRGPAGERTVRLDEFFALPEDERRTENQLGDNEMVTSVTLPNPPAMSHSCYLKAMDRKVWAFALAGAGAMLATDGQRITDARVVLGGVAPIPWRVPRAEQRLIGQVSGVDLFAQAAELALADAAPLAKNGHKVPLAKTLIRRALTEAAGEMYRAAD